MTNLILATPQISDLGTVTTGSEASGMEAVNVQSVQPGSVWRASDLGNAYIVFDLGSAQAIDFVGAFFSNASSDAEIQIRCATSEGNLTSSPTFNQTYDFWPHADIETDHEWMHSINVIAEQTARWWRIDILDPYNADDYIDIGRIYLSKVWQPTRNMEYGWDVGYDDPSTVSRSAGGQTYINRKRKSKVVTFTLAASDEDEMMNNALQIDRRRGSSLDVFVLLNPDQSRQFINKSIYGICAPLASISQREFRMFAKPYKIVELLP